MSSRVSPHHHGATHCYDVSSPAQTYKQLMRTFFHTDGSQNVNTSRRQFIAGAAGVAGSGLALGRPASWAPLADAYGLPTPAATKLTTFSKEDFRLIRNCVETMEQSVYEEWSSAGHRRAFDAWLGTTSINANLAPYLWSLFGAAYPIREHMGWDFHDATHRLEGRSGLVFSVTVDKSDNDLPLTATRGHLKAFIDLAKYSGTIDTANSVLTIAADIDGEYEKWVYFSEYVAETLMPAEVMWTRVNAAADEPHGISLWLAI